MLGEITNLNYYDFLIDACLLFFQTKKSGENVSKPRPKPNLGGTPGLLPPPPGGIKIPGPPRTHQTQSSPVHQPAAAPTAPPAAKSSTGGGDLDFLLDMGGSQQASNPSSQSQTFQQSSQSTQPLQSSDPWGDFTNNSASSG